MFSTCKAIGTRMKSMSRKNSWEISRSGHVSGLLGRVVFAEFMAGMGKSMVQGMVRRPGGLTCSAYKLGRAGKHHPEGLLEDCQCVAWNTSQQLGLSSLASASAMATLSLRVPGRTAPVRASGCSLPWGKPVLQVLHVHEPTEAWGPGRTPLPCSPVTSGYVILCFIHINISQCFRLFS